MAVTRDSQGFAGLGTLGTSPSVTLSDTSSGSAVAIGVDSADSGKFKIFSSTNNPTTLTGAQISIDPSTNNVSVNTGTVFSSTGIYTNTVQPLFISYLNANTTANKTGDGTKYQIVFDTSTVNQGSGFNTTTGVFTAPVAGNYMFITSFNFSGLVAQTYAIGYVTTTAFEYQGYTTGLAGIEAALGQVAGQVTCIAKMAASDTAVVNVIVAGSTKTVGIVGKGGSDLGTYFMGYLIA